MPYVNLQVTPGASRAAKAEIVRRFTDALVEVLSKKPEHIHVVIEEIEEENWGFAGVLTDEYHTARPEENTGDVSGGT